MLRAPIATAANPVLSGYSARDEFGQAAGNLTGKTLSVGGTWTGPSPGGSANDFTIDTGTGTAQRTSAADADENSGRYVTASTPTLAATVVQVTAYNSEVSSGQIQGVLARYTDTNNWVMAHFTSGYAGSATTTLVRVRKRVAGATPTIIGEALAQWTKQTFFPIRLLIDATGRVLVWYRYGALDKPIIIEQDAALATGGSLASGKVGIYDSLTTSNFTRRYEGFSAFVPSFDAVTFASQSVQLGTTGMYREDSTGVSYGPVSVVEGDLPRLPVSGQEGRTVQVMVKPSRGDFETLPDLGIDDASAQGNYRPCWLYVPGPFDPTAIAGLEFWFRPESLGDGGDPIATWTNEGSGTSLTQATGANQPIVEDNALNGKSAVSLDSTDFLSIATIPARSTRTVFIVAKQDAFLSSRAVIAFAGSNAELGSATTNQWCWRNNEAAVQVALGGSMTAWTLAGIRVTSTSVADAWLNGGALVNFDPFSSVVSGTSLTVGGGPWVGDVAEIICYSSALSETDRFRVLGYLSRKYPTLGSFGS